MDLHDLHRWRYLSKTMFNLVPQTINPLVASYPSLESKTFQNPIKLTRNNGLLHKISTDISNNLITSTNQDPSPWTKINPTPTIAQLGNIVYGKDPKGGDRYVANGKSSYIEFVYSTDGMNWMSGQIPRY